MNKKEIFEKINPKTLEKGEYLAFLCNEDGLKVFNIENITEIKDQEYDEHMHMLKTNIPDQYNDHGVYYPIKRTIYYFEIK